MDEARAPQAPWPDDEFVDYARARQHTLLRAAYLVCGDVRLAEHLLRAALVHLARQWDRVREEQPDPFVRRILYREAVASWRHRPPEAVVTTPAWDEPDEPWDDEEVKRRRKVLLALDALTPRQRAVVVLRWFEERGDDDVAEVLGCSLAEAHSDEEEALTGLRAAAPRRPGHPTPTMNADLRDLLVLASDDVPDLDLAPDAWAEARGRNRTVVRRSALVVGGVAAAGLVGLRVRERDPSPKPTPTAAATVAESRLSTVQVDEVTVYLAPDPPAEALLPRYPDAARLEVPFRLGPADQDVRRELGPGGGLPESLRAVFLVVAQGGGYHPVLFAPGAPFQVDVPGVWLNQSEGLQSALGPRCICDDRHRVVISQPGRVVMLDARDGAVVTIEVPDRTLSRAGWARDRTTVVAWGRDHGWLIDPQTREVRRARRAVNPDWADLAQDEGDAQFRSFSWSGELTGTTEVPGPPVVPNTASVSNTEGWVATGAFLPGAYQRAVTRSQGLVAVHAHLPPLVLAAPTGPLVPKGSYRALAWGPQDVVLFESRSKRAGFQGWVRRVLAWDVIEERLYHVADVDDAAGTPGGFSGTYTL